MPGTHSPARDEIDEVQNLPIFPGYGRNAVRRSRNLAISRSVKWTCDRFVKCFSEATCAIFVQLSRDCLAVIWGRSVSLREAANSSGMRNQNRWNQRNRSSR